MPSNLTLNTKVYSMLRKCIAADGDRLINKIETGRIDNCYVLNMTTFMLIEYLLRKLDPLPLDCLIPCDVTYKSNMTYASHNYLNKFVNFANQHCKSCM